MPGASGEVACETQAEVTDKLSVTSASEPSLAQAEAAAKVRSGLARFVGEPSRWSSVSDNTRCRFARPPSSPRALRMATQVFEGDFEKLMAAA